MRSIQENLRLSANQNQKMQREIHEYKRKIEENNIENDSLKNKINKLTSENVSLNKDVEGAQESLRLSANQMVKLNKELNEYKTQIGKNNDEN
jgi:chromosome segregation ATPase